MAAEGAQPPGTAARTDAVRPDLPPGAARVDIERLRADDRERWGELWSEYQAFYGIEIPADVTGVTWQRICDGRIHALGARTHEAASTRLMGIAHFLFHEDTWSTSPACYLQDLYVDPQARGGGCGRLLIGAVASAARAAGAGSPYWLTHETNAVARRLYDRLATNHGFIQYAYDAGR
jgi:GNAT superfamily N-acetyltransferase